MIIKAEKPPEPRTPTGGCSLGCASMFPFALIIWPMLHLLGGTYEPEVLLFSFAVAIPSFVVAHILAIFAFRSESPRAIRFGQWALGVMWGTVAILLLLGVCAFSLL